MSQWLPIFEMVNITLNTQEMRPTQYDQIFNSLPKYTFFKINFVDTFIKINK